MSQSPPHNCLLNFLHGRMVGGRTKALCSEADPWISSTFYTSFKMPPLQSVLSHMAWVFSIAGLSTEDVTASSKHEPHFKIVRTASLYYGDRAPIFHLAFGSVPCFSAPTELCAFICLLFFSILSLPLWELFSLYVSLRYHIIFSCSDSFPLLVHREAASSLLLYLEIT